MYKTIWFIMITLQKKKIREVASGQFEGSCDKRASAHMSQFSQESMTSYD